MEAGIEAKIEEEKKGIKNMAEIYNKFNQDVYTAKEAMTGILNEVKYLN